MICDHITISMHNENWMLEVTSLLLDDFDSPHHAFRHFSTVYNVIVISIDNC